jgi:hypothetical protein
VRIIEAIMSLKKVIPLTAEQLSEIEAARKAVKTAKTALTDIENKFTKPYEKTLMDWSVSIDGGFILVSRWDRD